jgi:hypothetical protein
MIVKLMLAFDLYRSTIKPIKPKPTSKIIESKIVNKIVLIFHILSLNYLIILKIRNPNLFDTTNVMSKIIKRNTGVILNIIWVGDL